MSLLHHLSAHAWTGYWAKLWTKVIVEHLSAILRTRIFSVVEDDNCVIEEDGIVVWKAVMIEREIDFCH